MKISYSERAISDLAEIHDYLTREYPGVVKKFDARLGEIEQRLLTFPAGGVAVEHRRGVYVAPFVSYPYRLFYKIDGDNVIILHIRNTSRRPWRA